MMEYTTTAGIQGICPNDWHIPTDYEWKMLEGEVDSQYGFPDPEWNNTLYRGFDAGLNLKSLTGWNWGTNGTDLYGFTGLPGGCRSNYYSYSYIGDIACWWTSNEALSGNYAWFRFVSEFSTIYRNYDLETTNGLSVRCIKDE